MKINYNGIGGKMMKIRGKSINLYLMDGNANGRVKCTLANWTGIAYKIPRVDLDLCKDRAELKQSGIYFLFGVNEDTQEPVVYVGQAGARKSDEGILNRLQEHKKNPNKEYWSEAVAFTTSSNYLGPTEISYLENRFYTIASAARRYIVKNKQDPNQGNVTEEKESELEEFIEYAKIIMGVLGHKIFEPLVSNRDLIDENNSMKTNTIFYLKSKGADARAIQTVDGFIVLSGSIIRKERNDSCPYGAINVRKIHENAIDKNMVLLKDIQFKTPSGAASFVLLSSVNGNKVWKNADGIEFGKYENMDE